MQTFFWISVSLLFYTYIGYGMLLLLINFFFKRRKLTDESFLPEVTFIVPAFNEEEIIEEKIINSLALDYPSHKISFLFITDGSTDRTTEIVRRFPNVGLLHDEKRMGKSAAINRVMQTVQTPIVVFSDANIILHRESILKMVKHYADSNIGGVSGEKRISAISHSAVGLGERLYWQYESLLKKANADFYTIVGAAGELFSIRTSLYQPIKEEVILDDFVISAKVCQQGYRFVYEHEAYGTETSSASIKEERKRKVRISAGCFQALFLLKGLLNPFKNLKVAFQYFSHRVLRWMACPLLLPAVLLANIFLVIHEAGDIFRLTLAIQSLFYLLALAGGILSSRKTILPWLLIPYYFVFMILSQYAGFARFITNKQTVFWEKVGREPLRSAGADR